MCDRRHATPGVVVRSKGSSKGKGSTSEVGHAGPFTLRHKAGQRQIFDKEDGQAIVYVDNPLLVPDAPVPIGMASSLLELVHDEVQTHKAVVGPLWQRNP